ncbi:MAG: hypothetical protein ABIQ29_05500 [Burkholderiaceae bacterium]
MISDKRLEAWVWISIYAGLLAFTLGWFVEARSASIGMVLMIGGGLAAAAGVLLVYLRAKRSETP